MSRQSSRVGSYETLSSSTAAGAGAGPALAEPAVVEVGSFPSLLHARSETEPAIRSARKRERFKGWSPGVPYATKLYHSSSTDLIDYFVKQCAILQLSQYLRALSQNYAPGQAIRMLPRRYPSGGITRRRSCEGPPPACAPRSDSSANWSPRAWPRSPARTPIRASHRTSSFR